jgi:chemotaxis protein MotB
MRRAVVLSTILLLSASASGCKAKKLQAELDQVRAQLSDTEGQLAAERDAKAKVQAENKTLQARIVELESEITQLKAQIEDLARQQGLTVAELEELRKEKAKREAELKVYKDLFAQLKKLIDSGKIEVVFRRGMLVVKLPSAVLFDSGKTSLKTEGQQALAELVPALQSVGNRQFLVAGHTDNIPIKTARFKNNWELSTSRAVVVVMELVNLGYPSSQIGAAGYAEFDPIGDNASEEGRASNRRIEIILMPTLGEIPGLRQLLES